MHPSAYPPARRRRESRSPSRRKRDRLSDDQISSFLGVSYRPVFSESPPGFGVSFWGNLGIETPRPGEVALS